MSHKRISITSEDDFCSTHKKSKNSADDCCSIIDDHDVGDEKHTINETKMHNVLLMTLLNPDEILRAQGGLTCRAINVICQRHASPLRVVIFKRNGFQAMIEFTTSLEAKKVKDELNNVVLDITTVTEDSNEAFNSAFNETKSVDSQLRFEYAWRTDHTLNVHKNDDYVCWDFTRTQGSYQRFEQDTLGYSSTSSSSDRLDMSYWGGYDDTPPMTDTDMSTRIEVKHETTVLGPRCSRYRNVVKIIIPDNYRLEDRDPSRSSSNEHCCKCHCSSSQMSIPVKSVASNKNVVSSRVIMVYGMSVEVKIHHIFNLFCLYGNVMRIKFMTSKEGCAMVEMENEDAGQAVIRYLNCIRLFDSKLILSHSKQTRLFPQPHREHHSDSQYDTAADTISDSFKDFTFSRLHRFKTLKDACRHLARPSNILHFYNTPPYITASELKSQLDLHKIQPIIYNNKKEKKTTSNDDGTKRVSEVELNSHSSSRGLLHFKSTGEATTFLAKMNHFPIRSRDDDVVETQKHPTGGNLCDSTSSGESFDAMTDPSKDRSGLQRFNRDNKPFIMRLCFSTTTSMSSN